jgi:capsular exopolysaccharide synthesis family protein
MDFEKQKEEKIDLLEYWRIIKKRKWLLVIFTCAVFLLVGIRTFTATPQYKATASLLIEEETSKILSIENEFGYRSQMSDLRYFNTQLILLRSESLAKRVVQRIDLASHPQFAVSEKPKKNFIKEIFSFKWLFPKKKPNDQESDGAKQQEENPYSNIAVAVSKEINLSPIRDTKVVEVSYVSPYPTLAAQLVNTLAEEFINFSIEKRYETTQQASDFLRESIIKLRADLAAKERELQRYGKEKKIFYLSDTESTAVSKFADLNDAFTQAQIDRIKAEAIYREIKDLNVDSLPQFVNDPAINQLKTEYTRMKNEYEEKSEIFKPNFPEMIQLKAKLDSMRKELKKAMEGAELEYRSSLKKEQSLRSLLNQQRSNVAKMNSNAILYNSLKIEVENKRKLLNSLEERQNETLVSARLGGLKTSNVGIVDRARVPGSPVSPNRKRNLILALIVGLFGGAGLCFFLEYLDNTVKDPEEVEKLSGLPSLGVIPFLSTNGVRGTKGYGYYSKHSYGYFRGEDKSMPKDAPEKFEDIELVNHYFPKFSISEDYRTVRTSILLSHADNPPKTFVFSSALPKEGKTASVANMGVAFSQLDKKVLIIDADLRKPRLHRIFRVRSHEGLSSYLTGRISIQDAIQVTSIDNIWLLPSGPIPPNPAELLNSKKMELLLEEVKTIYDVVLVDSPPVLVASDPVILSSMTDSLVFIVQAGKTAHKPFMTAVEDLRKANTKIIGVLFNEAKKERGSYYYSKYRSYYRDNYYSVEESGI